MFDNEKTAEYLARLIGVFIGVLASLIMVAPEATRNSVHRVAVSITMGFIFSPVVHHLPLLGFLGGPEVDLAMARGAATGFVVWSVLEVVARVMSSTDWIVNLLKEMARIRAGGGKE